MLILFAFHFLLLYNDVINRLGDVVESNAPTKKRLFALSCSTVPSAYSNICCRQDGS
jgi:hypothetical protein